MTISNYLVSILLALCVVNTMAALRGGTLTVHMNTTLNNGDGVNEVTHEDVLFDYVVKHINHGEFDWDNEWSFAELHTHEFKLYDQDGDVLIVKLHEGEHPSKDLRTILSTIGHSDVGRFETIASHIGNSVDLAYLKIKEANRKRVAAAKIAGQVAGQVATEVAQEVAEVVAKDVVEELLDNDKDSLKQEANGKRVAAAKTAGQVAGQVATEVAQEVAEIVAKDVLEELLDNNEDSLKHYGRSWEALDEYHDSGATSFKAVVKSKISL